MSRRGPQNNPDLNVEGAKQPMMSGEHLALLALHRHGWSHSAAPLGSLHKEQDGSTQCTDRG